LRLSGGADSAAVLVVVAAGAAAGLLWLFFGFALRLPVIVRGSLSFVLTTSYVSCCGASHDAYFLSGFW
jgi:hypothetical protein